MTKYRLASECAEDVDLTRHVRTPAGERYFHKPIGAPIGGGSTRGAVKVAKAASRWQIPGAATHEAAVSRFSTRGSKVQVKAASSDPFTALVERQKAGKASEAEEPTDANSLDYYGAIQRDIAKHFKDHPVSDKDKEALSRDLKLDPAFAGKSPREIRAMATDKRATKEQRAAAKTELINRVKAAKAVHEARKSLISALTTKLDDAPEDADLAPIIGETLASHPKFGPLAHIWDRLRLARYNFKKASTADVVKDKAGDVAKGIFTVLLAAFLLHLGVAVPGLVTGG